MTDMTGWSVERLHEDHAQALRVERRVRFAEHLPESRIEQDIVLDAYRKELDTAAKEEGYRNALVIVAAALETLGDEQVVPVRFDTDPEDETNAELTVWLGARDEAGLDARQQAFLDALAHDPGRRRRRLGRGARAGPGLVGPCPRLGRAGLRRLRRLLAAFRPVEDPAAPAGEQAHGKVRRRDEPPAQVLTLAPRLSGRPFGAPLRRRIPEEVRSDLLSDPSAKTMPLIHERDELIAHGRIPPLL